MRSTEQEQERNSFFASIVTAVFHAAHEHRSGGMVPSEVVVDGSGMIDALAFAQALILEFHPSVRTDEDIRRVVQAIGNELFRLIKVMRQSTDATGSHPIAEYGVTNPMLAGAN